MFCFYVVVLLSKLEARKTKSEKGEGQKVEQLPGQNQRGLFLFVTFEIIVFLIFVYFDVCRCVCLKTL